MKNSLKELYHDTPWRSNKFFIKFNIQNVYVYTTCIETLQ